MLRGWLVALVLVAGCKKYDEPKKIGESCKDDKDCAEPFVCREGLKATAVCVKPCGPSKIDEIQQRKGDEVAPDYTCPQGWECNAMLHSRYKNLETGEEGSSFGGLHDQPICVPTGWKPQDKPTAP
jgi:hypothetical protein